jgi:hypothetical protein
MEICVASPKIGSVRIGNSFLPYLPENGEQLPVI